MQDTSMTDKRFPAGKFAIGIALLGAGLLGLVSNYELHDVVRHYWPLLLIVAGLGTEIDALQQRRSGSGGIWLLGVGTWMLIGTNHWFGFDRRTAMPLGIIVVGLGFIAHALLGINGKKEKTSDEQQ
jgi:hypothetical protein